MATLAKQLSKKKDKEPGLLDDETQEELALALEKFEQGKDEEEKPDLAKRIKQEPEEPEEIEKPDLSKAIKRKPRPAPKKKQVETESVKPAKSKDKPTEVVEKKADELDKLFAPLEGELKKDDKYGTQLTDINTNIKALREEATSAREKTAWFQIADMFGKALTQYGAASEGLRTGADLSNIKFDSFDFEKQLDRQLAGINERLGDEKSKLGKLEGGEKLRKSKLDQLKLKKLGARLKNLDDKEQQEVLGLMQDKKHKQAEQLLSQKSVSIAGKAGPDGRSFTAETPGQKAADRAFAKNYVKFSDAAKTEAQIKELGDIKTLLEGGIDTASGRFVGLADWIGGKKGRDFIMPKGSKLQDRTELVIQSSLRQTLGSQFTKDEGENLLRRTYNTSQDESENARSIGVLIEQMRAAKKINDRAKKHFETYGTLVGFKENVIVKPWQLEGLEKKSTGQAEDSKEPTPLNDKDREALKWAKANPTDERAKEIRKQLGQ